MDPRSYKACGIMSFQETYVSTRVLHELKYVSAYFQSTIPLLFDDIRLAMKAWIDVFKLPSNTKGELINILERLIVICKEHNLRISAKK